MSLQGNMREDKMITVTIDQPELESSIVSLAQAHKRPIQDIITGALANHLGLPELLYHMQWLGSTPDDSVQPVAA